MLLAARPPPKPPVFTGPPLIPIIPINIITPSGNPLRNDNTTNLAYMGNGTGVSPPERYSAYHPSNLTDTRFIRPGNSTLLKNHATSKFCRLALGQVVGRRGGGSRQVASCGSQGMVCDQDSAAGATVLTYTGAGLSYDGVALTVLPGSGTLVLPLTGSGCGESALSFRPAPSGTPQYLSLCSAALELVSCESLMHPGGALSHWPGSWHLDCSCGVAAVAPVSYA